MRGSRPAVQGRSRKGTKLVTQLSVGDDDSDEDAGVVRHKLPPAKKIKRAQPHSLKDAVKENRRPAKKH